MSEQLPRPSLEPRVEASPVDTGDASAMANPTVGLPTTLDGIIRALPVPGHTLIDKLGQGAFARVWKARDANGFEVALKILLLDKHADLNDIGELNLMKNVRHPHVLPLHGTWQNGDWLVIFLELADRTLLDRLKQAKEQGHAGIPFEELREYVREAAKGLDFLHETKQIQHRDVKPANLLLVGGSVKVADFGLAKLLQTTVKTNTNQNMEGTPAFMAPELWHNQTHKNSDQYALAASYCQLRGGELLFRGESMAALFNAHCNGTANLPTLLTEQERVAVTRALAKNPDERWPDCLSFAKALAGEAASPPSIVFDTSPVRPAVSIPVGPVPLTTVVPTVHPRRRNVPRPRWLVVSATLLLLPLLLILFVNVPWPTPTVVPRQFGIPLVCVPAGSFWMGSPPRNEDRDTLNDERPRRQVKISAFQLGKHEVTRGQFRQFVEHAGYETEAVSSGRGSNVWNADAGKFMRSKESNWLKVDFDQTDEHPVVCVSWNDAVAFCNWLSQQEGRRPCYQRVGTAEAWECDFSANGYRLPTEAEWEYACRAGTATRYASGDAADTLALVGNVADGTAKKRFPPWTTIAAEDGYVFTAPVCTFKPNAWGLHDMHGNAWEWCHDWYGKDHYGKSDNKDPQGPKTGRERVQRGGSWLDGPKDCRAAFRSWGEPSDGYNNVGFRVAVSGGD